MWCFTFLNVKVKKLEGIGFLTSIFRKKTFTGVYLNWNNLTTSKYKIGLIRCVLSRAWNIRSNFDLFHIEVLKTKTILNKNGYPRKVIDKEVEKFINSKYIEGEREVDERRKVYISLPYFGTFAEDFKKTLTQLIKDNFPEINLIVAFKSPKTIGSFFQFKDKVPSDLVSGVVYCVKCLDCEASYIGKTMRN